MITRANVSPFNGSITELVRDMFLPLRWWAGRTIAEALTAVGFNALVSRFRCCTPTFPAPESVAAESSHQNPEIYQSW